MTKQFDKKSKIRISFFVPFFNTYYKTVLRTLDRYDLFFARVNLPILIVKKGVIITLKFRILPIPKSKHTYTLLFHTISNCIELNIEIFGLSLNEKTFSSEEVTFYAVKTLRRSNNGTIFLTLIYPLLLVEKPYRTKFMFFATIFTVFILICWEV